MLTIKEKLPVHQVIASQLRQQISDGIISRGQPIPSYRALMETYGVTVGTVRQAVMSLQAQGLIESVAGVGCVVIEPRVESRRVGIAMVGESEAPGIIQQLNLIHDDLDSMHCDVGIRFVPTVNQEAIDALVRWGKRHDGVLLRGRVPMRLASIIAEAGIPMVMLGEPIDGPCPATVSNVTVDVPSMVELAVSHLVSLGHRRIGICSSLESHYFGLVSESFRRCASDYGIAGEISEWYSPLKGPDPREAVPAWLATLAVKPTALLVEAGPRAAAVIAGLEDQGMAVPRDISVMGIVAVMPTEPPSKRISSVITPLRDLILRGTSMLVGVIRSNVSTVRSEKIVARYLPGYSCQLIASADAVVGESSIPSNGSR